MIAEKVKASNIGVGVGIVLELAGRATTATGMPLAGYPILLVGLGAFVWGCFNYSEAKGYSKYLGFLGILSCLGLIVLICLPDKNKFGGPPSGNPYGPDSGQAPGSWPPPPNNPQ